MIYENERKLCNIGPHKCSAKAAVNLSEKVASDVVLEWHVRDSRLTTHLQRATLHKYTVFSKA